MFLKVWNDVHQTVNSGYPEEEELERVCGGAGGCMQRGIAYQLDTHPALTFLARRCSTLYRHPFT